MPLRLSRLALATLFAGAAGLALADNPASPAPSDLYQLPALHSSLAPQALMLSVTQAGARLVAVGERGFILVSDDAGNHWRQVDSPVSVTLTRVRFVTPEQGWAVGHAGVVLHSADGGLSWQLQLDGVRAAQLALEAARAATGAEAQARLDEAQRLVDDGPDKPLLNLYFSDARHGLVIGAYGLAFATEDGGAHWRFIGDRLANPSALHLYDIAAVGTALFITGEQGLLLRSLDAGASFQALPSPAQGTLFGLAASGEHGLLVFGLRGKALRSDDLGATWQALPNPQNATYTAGLRLHDGALLLADESGALRLSRDAGQHFSALPATSAGYITGLAELPDGHLLVSSPHGVLRVALDTPPEPQP